MKIDLVYLWVDGDDPNWLERRSKYIEQTDQTDKQSFCRGRLVENEELRYSLRSVDRFAPWINHIFIVTDRQVPKWLDKKNTKITIIDHLDILHKENLPVYNSNTIERAIHLIDGLSEHYIYANDDMMFGRELSPQYFFTSKGKPICRFIEADKLNTNNTFSQNIALANTTISKDFDLECGRWKPHHQIDAYRKTDVSKCLEVYKDWSEAGLSNRFRKLGDMSRHIFSLYAIATDQGEKSIIKSPFNRTGIISTIISLFLNDSQVVDISRPFMLLRVLLFRPKLICFNDTERANDIHRVKLKKVLSQLYPNPSQYEK